MKKIFLVCLVALFSVAVADAQAPKKGEKKTVTTEFLTDIDCEGCAKKVTNTIPYEKGVKDVKVDVPTKTVTVTYDPAKTNDEALIKAFAKIKINASAGCNGECCGHDHKAEKKECTDACCEGHDHKAEKKECTDACCEGHDHKAEKKECTDACCDGHDHNHGHSHDHSHKH